MRKPKVTKVTKREMSRCLARWRCLLSSIAPQYWKRDIEIFAAIQEAMRTRRRLIRESKSRGGKHENVLRRNH
jgi:hypothetical protein